MAQRTAVQKPLVNWLSKHVGETFNIIDVMDEMPDDANEISVRRCLTTDLPRKGFKIATVVSGSVYRFEGYEQEQPKTTGRIFEQIGTTKEGKLVLQDEDGSIFLAREID